MKLIDISPYAYCGGDPVTRIDMVRLARLADKGIDAIKLGRELGAFEKASEFGVNSYKSLKTAVTRKYGKNSGLEVHHLIEKDSQLRFK